MSENKNFLENFTPKQTFIIGVVGGFLVLCAVGFFILLTMSLKGNLNNADNPNGKDSAVAKPVDEEQVENISVKPVDLKTDHIRGNKDAKVTIVEFSDTQCPYCVRFHSTMKQIIEKYGDKIRWVYRHSPIDSLHPNARTEALASECANEQGKFWEYLDLLYGETVNDIADLTGSFATQLGLNVNNLKKCIDDKKYASLVSMQEADASVAGSRGTPHSVIIGPNGELEPLRGAQPFEAVETLINKFLK